MGWGSSLRKAQTVLGAPWQTQGLGDPEPSQAMPWDWL